MRFIFAATVAATSLAGIATAQPAPAPDPKPAMHISDADIAGWFQFRQSKFAELHAANPNQGAQIEAMKAATAAAIAAAGPMGGLDAPPLVWRSGAAIVLYEDPSAPRMAVIPAGEFTMGSPDAESGHAADEAPRHRVRIAYPLAVSLFPIVYGEYALFTAATHRSPGGRCDTIEKGRPVPREGRNWRDTGYPQTVRYPAVCIRFDDATAYAAWLSRKTGHTYRLLSEAEYEYVERAGATDTFSWGNDANAGCAFANGLDQAGKTMNPTATPSTCNDGYPAVAPEGSLKPNGFGLFDTSGNVASWTADCWNPGYAGAPSDGSANQRGDCRYRVVRGASWASADLRSASRSRALSGTASELRGFRLAREL